MSKRTNTSHQTPKSAGFTPEENSLLVIGNNALPREVYFSLDTQGTFLAISPSIEQLSHYRVDELVGKPFACFVHPDDLPELQSKFGQTLEGTIGLFEFRVFSKEGEVLFVRTSSRQLWEGNHLSGLTGVMVDITEQKRTEEELRESQQRLAEIINFLPDATFAIDRAGKVIIWNHAIEEMTGVKTEDIVGKGDYEYALPFYGVRKPILIDLISTPIHEIEKNYHSIRKEGDVLLAEADVPVKGGQVRSLWGKAVPLYDSKRNIVGGIEAIRDITGYKQAEAERKAHIHFLESLEQIDLAIKQAKDVEQLLENSTRVVFSIYGCDRAWFLYPCDPDTPSFRVVAETLRPEFSHLTALNQDIPVTPGEAHLLRVALESHEPVVYLGESEKPISTTVQFNIQSQMFFPIYPRLGKSWVFGMHQCSYPRLWTKEEQKLFKEISHRISDALSSTLFLRELQDNEERFRVTFEQAAMGIAHVACDGQWLRVNRKLCDIVGYPIEEILQKTFPEITYPEDLNIDLDYVRQIQAGETPTYSIEKRLIHKDGSLVWANLTVSIVPRVSNKPGYFIYIIEDITGRKRAEKELFDSRAELATLNNNLKIEILERKHAEEENLVLNASLERRVRERTHQLEISNRELESFSYSVSHDLRAPLRSINGFSLALLEDYGDRLDPTAQEYLTRIRSSTQHMAHLIDDLLRLARVTRCEMQMKNVDLCALAHTILEELQITQPERQVTVLMPEKLVVWADLNLMNITLDNLLRNAWKFTRKCPDATIELGSYKKDAKEVFFVRDNGAGFDMAFVDKLFKSFERLHEPREYEGTGIGLAIVKQIIQRHGGQVWAEGEIDKGATVYFTIS